MAPPTLSHPSFVPPVRRVWEQHQIHVAQLPILLRRPRGARGLDGAAHSHAAGMHSASTK
eukprot:scaffold29945_cov112-Isochrysis_galbana.AAC.2